MAIQSVLNTSISARSRLATWLALANGDTGQPFSSPDYGGDATVTFEGTFGAGGSITLQGSNDNVNWYPLTDPQGNAITKTAAAIETIEEAPLFMRPNVTAGDGTTALQCRVLFRKVF